MNLFDGNDITHDITRSTRYITRSTRYITSGQRQWYGHKKASQKCEALRGLDRKLRLLKCLGRDTSDLVIEPQFIGRLAGLFILFDAPIGILAADFGAHDGARDGRF